MVQSKFHESLDILKIKEVDVDMHPAVCHYLLLALEIWSRSINISETTKESGLMEWNLKRVPLYTEWRKEWLKAQISISF